MGCGFPQGSLESSLCTADVSFSAQVQPVLKSSYDVGAQCFVRGCLLGPQIPALFSISSKLGDFVFHSLTLCGHRIDFCARRAVNLLELPIELLCLLRTESDTGM